MTALFLCIATGMLLVALACIVLPLWRAARAPAGTQQKRQLEALRAALDAGVISADEYTAKRALLDALPADTAAAPTRSRSAFNALLAAILILPLGALGLYRYLGEPRALDPAAIAKAAPADHGPEMEQAIAGLEAKMKANPDDIEGWLLLGRAYKAQQRFVAARDALKSALDHAKDNPDVMVEYAEALALSSESHQLEGEPRKLLAQALAIDPASQRGLWLLGIAEYQAGNWQAAIDNWQKLEAQLPADSDVKRSVETQIAQAKLKAGMPTDNAPALASAAAAPTTPPTATDASGPHITVQVSLSPKLADKVSPDDALFVFAKAANGPPMPLAVKRLRAGDLPTTVVLTDGMGMMPSMKLSQFPQVILGARVSKSGNAIPASGDLQVLSAATPVGTMAPVSLVIDQVVP